MESDCPVWWFLVVMLTLSVEKNNNKERKNDKNKIIRALLCAFCWNIIKHTHKAEKKIYKPVSNKTPVLSVADLCTFLECLQNDAKANKKWFETVCVINVLLKSVHQGRHLYIKS